MQTMLSQRPHGHLATSHAGHGRQKRPRSALGAHHLWAGLGGFHNSPASPSSSPKPAANDCNIYSDTLKQHSSGPAAASQSLGGRRRTHSAPQQAALPSQPLLGAHPALKYAQMGHSSYGRGAPHVCYMQLGSQGVFYSRADQELHGQQQQQGWARLAAHIAHAASGILTTGDARSRSVLAGAAAAGTGGAGAAAAEVPPKSLTHPHPVGAAASGSSGAPGVVPELRPQWHVALFQALLLAAALLVTGLLLKHFFRSVVATLVACYSGLPFKA